MPENGISLCLGLNTYMDKFPEWNQTYFPTFYELKGRILMAIL